MNGRVQCLGCGEWHFPKQAWAHTGHVVNRPAVNAEAARAVNRRGAYPNTDARREYMRKKMAQRRAEGKA